MILVRRLLTMIITGIGQPCDSESSVPETTGLKDCLLHGIVKRLSQIKYPMYQRSQINLLYQSRFRNNSSSSCCKPTHTNRQKSMMMLPTASNCMGRPSNFLTALEAVTCQFQQYMPSNRKYTTFIRICDT